jgi:hypothetical protein
MPLYLEACFALYLEPTVNVTINKRCVLLSLKLCTESLK